MTPGVGSIERPRRLVPTRMRPVCAAVPGKPDVLLVPLWASRAHWAIVNDWVSSWEHPLERVDRRWRTVLERRAEFEAVWRLGGTDAVDALVERTVPK